MKLPKQIEKALEETRLPWTVEQGGQHVKLRLAGKMVGVLPSNLKEGQMRTIKNTVSQIRRAAREVAR